jgi:hypothetical protein
MFIVQISLLIVTFLFLISRNLWLMQTTQEVNPHPRIAPCVNMWRVTFSFFVFYFFLCHLLNVGCTCPSNRLGRPSGVDHHTSVDGERTNSNSPHISFVFFQSVTYYTNSIVSRIHVNTTKLCNITCNLVATGVILRSLECTPVIWIVVYSFPVWRNIACHFWVHEKVVKKKKRFYKAGNFHEFRSRLSGTFCWVAGDHKIITVISPIPTIEW